MNNIESALNAANAQLAAEARRDVIAVDEQIVITGDKAEFGGASTLTIARTNHQITAADRLGMYQTPGWHGLGEVIPDWLNGRQAVERFIGWSVVPQPVYTTWGEGEKERKIRLPMCANVRSDTGEVLGVVSDQYKLVQNADVGEFADALLEEAKLEGVGVRMETCGSLLGGRKVFLTMRPDRDIRVGKGGDDVTIPLLTIINGHDGSLAMSAAWTFVRVVCNNTFTSALGSVTTAVEQGKGFRIRHSGKVTDYLQQAKAALGIAVKGLEKYQQIATAMADKKMGGAEIRAFFEDAYADMFGRPEETPTTDAEKAAAQKRDVVVNEWTRLMGDECQLIPGMAGSLWAAFNCITQWQDHTRAARTVKTDGRRDHLKLLGAGANDKRKAFRAALTELSA